MEMYGVLSLYIHCITLSICTQLERDEIFGAKLVGGSVMVLMMVIGDAVSLPELTNLRGYPSHIVMWVCLFDMGQNCCP